jgi:hypothetical protein
MDSLDPTHMKGEGCGDRREIGGGVATPLAHLFHQYRADGEDVGTLDRDEALRGGRPGDSRPRMNQKKALTAVPLMNFPLRTEGGNFPLRLEDRRDTGFQGGIVTS